MSLSLSNLWSETLHSIHGDMYSGAGQTVAWSLVMVLLGTLNGKRTDYFESFRSRGDVFYTQAF